MFIEVTESSCFENQYLNLATTQRIDQDGGVLISQYRPYALRDLGL
jgi:hypothetical protein